MCIINRDEYMYIILNIYLAVALRAPVYNYCALAVSLLNIINFE